MAWRGNDEWFGTWNWPPDGSDGKIIPAPKIKSKSRDKYRINITDDGVIEWGDYFTYMEMSDTIQNQYKPPDFSKYIQEIKDSYTKRGLELPEPGDGWGKIKYCTRRGPWSNRGETPEDEDILFWKIKVIEGALPESLQGRLDYSEFTARTRHFVRVKETEKLRQIRPRKKPPKAFVEAMKQKKLLESRPKKEKFKVQKNISLRPIASQQAETPCDVLSLVVSDDMSLYNLEDLKSCAICEKEEVLDEKYILDEDDAAFSNFISIVEGIFRRFIRFSSAKMITDIQYLEDSESNILDPEMLKIRSKKLLISLIGDAAYPETDEGLAKFWYDVETMNEMGISDVKYLAEEVRNLL